MVTFTTYPIAELERFADRCSDAADQRSSRKMIIPKPRPLTTKGFNKLYDLVNACEASPVGGRSEPDYELCCVAIESEWSQDEVWDTIKASGKFRDRGRGYFDLTWECAQEKVRLSIYKKKKYGTAGKLEKREGDRAIAEATAKQDAGTLASEEKTPDQLLRENHIMRVQRIGMDILGEYEDSGRIACYSRYHKKLSDIGDIDKIRYPKLLQICGAPAAQYVKISGDDLPPGYYTLNEVKESVGYLAGFRQLTDDSITGPGCWPGMDAQHEHDDSIVVVSGTTAAYLNGGPGLHMLDYPICGSRILMLNTGTEWCDLKATNELILNYSVDWARDTIKEAEDLFSKWNWQHQVESPTLIVGLVLASWVQTVWDWRPHISITGKSNTGKSTLFHTLGDLFGRLGERASKPSEAGLRQSIQHTAKIPIVDEFEKSRDRDRILENIRHANRGDSKPLGTTQQNKPRKFHSCHMHWIGAIETGLRREADKNRFIHFELLPPTTEKAGKLIPPSVRETRYLGQRLFAIALRAAIASRDMAIRLKSAKIASVDRRSIESYAVPASILSVAIGKNDEYAESLMRRMLTVIEPEDEPMSEEEELLRVLLGSDVRVGTNDTQTVSELLGKFHDNDGFYQRLLGRHGITLHYERIGRPTPGWMNAPDERLGIDPDMAYRKLLFRSGAQDEWQGKTLVKILRRIPGSDSRKISFAERRGRGVSIPTSYVREKFMHDKELHYEEF